MSEAALKRQELIRGWPVVLASLVGVITGIAVMPYYMIGPLTGPLQAEFGWDRTSILTVATFFTFGQFLGTPVAGRLADRFGPRATATISMIVLAIGMASLAVWMNTLIVFRIGFLALAFVCAGSGAVSFTRAVGHAFVHARGLALGVAMAGSGVAAFLAPLLVEAASEHGGWRTAMLTISGLTAVSVPVVWWGLKGAASLGEGATPQAATSDGVAWSLAVRDLRFHLLGVIFVVLGLFVGGIILHTVPMLIEQGATPARAAQIASLSGLALIASRILTGWLLDRFSPTWVAFVMFLFGAAGCLALAVLGPAVAPLTIIAMGFMVGAEIDVMSFLILRYFGVRNYGTIYGIIYSLFTAGSLATPWFTGTLVDRGGFPALFATAAAGFTLVAFLFPMLGWLTRDRRGTPAGARTA